MSKWVEYFKSTLKPNRKKSELERLLTLFKKVVCSNIENYKTVIDKEKIGDTTKRTWDYIFYGNAPFWKFVDGSPTDPNVRKRIWRAMYDVPYKNNRKNMKAICDILEGLFYLVTYRNFEPNDKPDDRDENDITLQNKVDWINYLPSDIKKTLISMVLYDDPMFATNLLKVSKTLNSDVVNSPDYIAFREAILISNIASKSDVKLKCRLVGKCFAVLSDIFTIVLSQTGVTVRSELITLLKNKGMIKEWKTQKATLIGSKDELNKSENTFVGNTISMIKGVLNDSGKHLLRRQLTYENSVKLTLQLFDGLTRFETIIEKCQIDETKIETTLDNVPKFVFWYIYVTTDDDIPFYLDLDLLDKSGRYRSQKCTPLLNNSDVFPIGVLTQMYVLEYKGVAEKTDVCTLSRVTAIHPRKMFSYLKTNTTSWDRNYVQKGSNMFPPDIDQYNNSIDLSLDIVNNIGISRAQFGIYDSLFSIELIGIFEGIDSLFRGVNRMIETQIVYNNQSTRKAILLSNIIKGLSNITPVVWRATAIRYGAVVFYKGFIICSESDLLHYIANQVNGVYTDIDAASKNARFTTILDELGGFIPEPFDRVKTVVVDLHINNDIDLFRLISILPLFTKSGFFCIQYPLVSSHTDPKYINRALKMVDVGKTLTLDSRIFKLAHCLVFENDQFYIYPCTIFSTETIPDSNITVDTNGMYILATDRDDFINRYSIPKIRPYTFSSELVNSYKGNAVESDTNIDYWKEMVRKDIFPQKIYTADLKEQTGSISMLQFAGRYVWASRSENNTIVFDQISLALFLPFQIVQEYRIMLAKDMKVARIESRE